MADLVNSLVISVSILIPLAILYLVRNASKSWLWAIFFLLYFLLHTDTANALRKENAFLDFESSILTISALVFAVVRTFKKQS